MRQTKQAQAVVCAAEKGYRVEDDGTVVGPSGKVLSSRNRTKEGYLMVSVRMKELGRVVGIKAHQLAAFQKFGEVALSDGVQVRHKDNDPGNCALENILIGTPSQNSYDRPAEQRAEHARVAAAARRTLTVKAAQELIQDRSGGMSYLELMEKYGLTKSCVSYIVNGKTYPELDRSGLPGRTPRK